MPNKTESLNSELKEFILENIVLEPYENAEDIARDVLEGIPVASWLKDSKDWKSSINTLRELAIKEIQSWL